MTVQNQYRSRFQSPLARRMVIKIILLSSVITLLLTGIQLFLTYRNEMTGIEADLEQIKNVHTKALSQSLWAANRKELDLQLGGIIKIPNIIYASIYEGDRIWAEIGNVQLTNSITRHYHLTYPYRGEEHQIGILTVSATLDNVYNYLIQQAIIILASNAFKTFLVAAFMFMLFHKHVTRYLFNVTDYVRNLDISSVGLPLSLQRKPSQREDEFDILVDVVNRMLAKNQVEHAALVESKEHFHAIANFTIDWESWVDITGKLKWVNPSVLRVTGYTPEECYAMPDYPLPMVAAPKDRDHLQKKLARAMRGSTAENIEVEMKHKDGTRFWVAISWQPIYGLARELLGYRSSVRDISYLKEIEYSLQEKVQEIRLSEDNQKRLLILTQQEKARITSLLGAMNIGILFEDVDNNVIYINPTFRRIWLIPDNVDLIGFQTVTVLQKSGNVLSRPDHFSKHILRILGTQEVSESFEIAMADGRMVTQVSYPVSDQDGRFIGRLWVYEDVTREKQTAEQLIYLAERDSLTGLFNRHRFQEELARMLVDADRNSSHGALLFFDLDEFKYINDTFGHRAGDTMLVRVAGEVSALIRRNEIVARIGGDEFAILLPNADQNSAIRLAERIIRATSKIPFRFEGQNLRLTTSLGIALYPEHGANAEELVAHADAAMYQAKEAGKNAWRKYNYDLDTSREMISRMSWNERIRNAMENNLFRLHFQGVYKADNRQLSHLEALVRMQDVENSMHVIMPNNFIPSAEKTGKILDIDHWVIYESIRLLAATPHLPAIAVNISGRSFDNPELPQYIYHELQSFKVEPSRLMVELTETSAVSDLHDAQRFIESLHQAGCKVCLDDFGSGFSSFAYLKHLKADILKIDGVFIRDLPNDHDNQIFVKSIVDVARGMHKQTVAEFVEDAETLEMLNSFGVDFVQGYHLDMPQLHHPAFQIS